MKAIKPQQLAKLGSISKTWWSTIN